MEGQTITPPDMNDRGFSAKFLAIDFDENTITFQLSPEDVGRFRWHAGTAYLNVTGITERVTSESST